MLFSSSVSSHSGRLPRIKVCGVTLASDLEFLAACKVEAVGLNLVPTSKRYLRLETAVTLAARAAELGMRSVAVVMDPLETDLARIAAAFSWDYLQLHGQEMPEIARACQGIAIIKAVSWSGRSEEAALVDRWSHHFGESPVSPLNLDANGLSRLSGFLLDAYSPGLGGGSGQRARWDLLYPRPKLLDAWPVMLAGGLTAENVRSAIEATHCDGVDAASGVEISPGVKSQELVGRFVAAANLGLASISGT